MSAELTPTFNPDDGGMNYAERQVETARARSLEAEQAAVNAVPYARTLADAALHLDRAAEAADKSRRPNAAAAYRAAAASARAGLEAEARAALGWQHRDYIVPVPIDNR